jgi:hypothetical protein
MDVLKENTDHSLALEFVRKLGMCYDFFRGVLDHLIRLTVSVPALPKEELGNVLSKLGTIESVLNIYSTCLTPPPNDSRTNVMVRLAHQTLQEARIRLCIMKYFCITRMLGSGPSSKLYLVDSVGSVLKLH